MTDVEHKAAVTDGKIRGNLLRVKIRDGHQSGQRSALDIRLAPSCLISCCRLSMRRAKVHQGPHRQVM